MDPTYQFIIEPSEFAWTILGYGSHLLALLVHAGLALYLLAVGVARVYPRRAQSFGLASPKPSLIDGATFPFVICGALLAPLLANGSMLISLCACLGAVVFLVTSNRSGGGNASPSLVHKVAALLVASAALFMVWEREDNLVLGFDVFSQAMHWRTHEMDWQRANDPYVPQGGRPCAGFRIAGPQRQPHGAPIGLSRSATCRFGVRELHLTALQQRDRASQTTLRTLQ